MALTPDQKKQLRRLGHALQPVILIGQQGLTAAVTAEAAAALAAHELLKVRARVGDRDRRAGMLAELARRTGAELVQTIGNVGLFYKKNNKLSKILLPDT
jgi:RNA-binding protein